MNHNGHLCVWMATTTRSNSCRPLRALTSERNSCCFAGRCSLYLARKRGRDSCESHCVAWRTPPPSSVCVGGGRVARLFCQRGDALEGLVGPCEAGARTAAPAQTGSKQESQQHKERNGRKRCAYPHLTVTCGPFSRPIVVTRVPEIGGSRGGIPRNSSKK